MPTAERITELKEVVARLERRVAEGEVAVRTASHKRQAAAELGVDRRYLRNAKASLKDLL